MGQLRLVPVRLRQATAFVREYHRHIRPPQGGLFAVGVWDGRQLVGVAIAGRPVSRVLDNGRTVEITRCCTTGGRNACSMLYGAVCRAAAALGYVRAVTYTLASEPGSSLRASGFELLARVKAGQWDCPSRRRVPVAAVAKFRWVRQLGTDPLPPYEPLPDELPVGVPIPPPKPQPAAQE